MEQGKDIVMWKLGDLGERENYAVVVLADRVSGKATGQNSAGKVATQIQQAFATRIRDETTATELGVDKVWVVTSREITKEAQESGANVICEQRQLFLSSPLPRSGSRATMKKEWLDEASSSTH